MYGEQCKHLYMFIYCLVITKIDRSQTRSKQYSITQIYMAATGKTVVKLDIY